MIVKRENPFNPNEIREMEINISKQAYLDWQNGALIQKVAPELTAEEREFIISGLIGNEFEEIFGKS